MSRCKNTSFFSEIETFFKKKWRYRNTSHDYGLLLGITDGTTFRPLDFSLHGEKGKGGVQGLTAKQRKARKETDPGVGTPASIRHSEYFKSKIGTMLEMVRRAKRGGEDLDYLLVDSWFMCSEVVKTVTGLGRHVLGMLKSNINSFSVDGEMLKTEQMVSRFRKDRKRCRKYRCEYITVNTDLWAPQSDSISAGAQDSTDGRPY